MLVAIPIAPNMSNEIIINSNVLVDATHCQHGRLQSVRAGISVGDLARSAGRAARACGPRTNAYTNRHQLKWKTIKTMYNCFQLEIVRRAAIELCIKYSKIFLSLASVPTAAMGWQS